LLYINVEENLTTHKNKFGSLKIFY
jgi:hypothetical protein